jgi:hypothetical protein
MNHIVVFDDSGLATSLDFLQNKSDGNLKKLISAPGNKLAYVHYLWSCIDASATAEEFWSTQMSKFSWSSELERNMESLKTYLLNQKKTEWLSEVLNYLPETHEFNTTVYLNLGYDNIVYGENVALDMGNQSFSLDKRESKYYLIHELAHAGYVRYHPLPELRNVKTNEELLRTIKTLTQLEGMGVISAFRLRVLENGLLDNDYKVLLDNTEKTRRVNRYFELLAELGSAPKKGANKNISKIFEEMSRKETRLWYITGCHMAQEIEKHAGIRTLRRLVEEGSEDFFNTFLEFAPKIQR